MMAIDHLVSFAQRNIIIKIKPEYLTIIKFILKTIDRK